MISFSFSSSHLVALGEEYNITNNWYMDFLQQAQVNEKAVQAQFTAFNNYMGELGKLHYRGANALATALQSRLWDIQNRYAGRLMNSGRTEIAGVYAAQGQEL